MSVDHGDAQSRNDMVLFKPNHVPDPAALTARAR